MANYSTNATHYGAGTSTADAHLNGILYKGERLPNLLSDRTVSALIGRWKTLKKQKEKSNYPIEHLNVHKPSYAEYASVMFKLADARGKLTVKAK